MVSLTSTLSIASQALSAEGGALGVTNNNIANVNTPGYAREVVNLTDAAVSNGSSQSAGVSYEGFTSLRDEVLQLGVNEHTAVSAGLQAQSALWDAVESQFSDPSSGLGSAISSLFSSLSALSTAPRDGATRQAALSSAGNLVNAFHSASSALSDASNRADATVSGTVAQINKLTAQIATLNGQVAQLQASGQDGGGVRNQRDALTTQVAQLVGVSLTATDTTPSLSLGNGSPLVVGHTSFSLQATREGDGKTHVLDAQGRDLTSALAGGSLGGSLTMRDDGIPPLSAALDQLASQIAVAFNNAQASGYDQTGASGTPLFSVPANGTSAAAGIRVALSDPSALAISSDGSAGSSGNLSQFLTIQTAPLGSGESPTDTYASFVETVGNASSEVSTSLTATNATLAQLTSQQSSETGVSIDEETTNLLRFQQAYSAAAKVVSVMNDLYSTLLNMVNS